MQFANLINGQWVETAQARPNINPSDTSDVIGQYASGAESDVGAV
jgi:alpha-ketoglutaric semialdehyde dehydrogenase